MTEEEFRELSAKWLNPIDLAMADLIDKSERMTIGSFNDEVEKIISQIPQMFGLLDRQAFIDSLEDQIGSAMLKGLES